MSTIQQSCTPELDRGFGPVTSCQDFDLTLAFEQSIFGIGVSSLVLIFTIICFGRPVGAERVAHTSRIYFAKVALATANCALQLACLVLWIQNPITAYSIAAAAVALTGATAITALVIKEHRVSAQPSSLVSIYFLCKTTADSVQLRTLVLRGYTPAITKVLAADISIQVAFLLLESWPKERHVKSFEKYSPEDLAGIFNRSLIWWLNPLFILGSKSILRQSDLYNLDFHLHSNRLRAKILPIWEKNKSRKHPFLRSLISLLFVPWLQMIPSRACTTALNYSQTFLLNDAVSYLARPTEQRNKDHAYGMVAATALIYFGLAIFKATRTGKWNRIITTFRGSIIALIYLKSLQYPSTEGDLPAVTLMSTDIDQLTTAIMYAADFWACALETGIGAWLIWRQMGPIALAPILVVILCSAGNILVGRAQGKRRGIWVTAIQRRVGFTSRILGSMKSVKLSGLSETSAKQVQAERIRELDRAKELRGMIIWQNSLANLPITVSGLLVFAVYAAQAHFGKADPLTAAKAFTSLALISLMISPSSQLIVALSSIIGASGCVTRIRKFLKEAKIKNSHDFSEKLQELKEKDVVVAHNIILDLNSKTEPTPINLSIAKATITMISGPVGCGKTTLLRLLLGETKPKSGTVSVSSTYIGYCSPKPWLRNDTIKNNILGPNPWDEARYLVILRLCDLESDISQMADQDDSQVGSRGLSLSGGQKHRIALARALYSQCSLLLLDDPFSSLDRKTRTLVATRLFGRDGHAQKHGITVIFASHEDDMARYSDNVITLCEGGSLVGVESSANWIAKNPLKDDLSNEQDSDEVATKHRPASRVATKVVDEDPNERIKRQVGDTAVWKYYARTAGLWQILLLLLFLAMTTIGTNFPQLWLRGKTGSSAPSLGVFIGVYAIVVVATLSAMVAQFRVIMLQIAPTSASKLHQILVTTTFNAPMSFFDSTETSMILNRFSQDMTLVDLALPIGVWLTCQSIFSLVMQLVLICLGSSYMACTVPFTFFTVYWIQKFYLRTSRQMRFLDLEAKSPLYRQFTETLEGVATIRGLGCQSAFEDEFLAHLDESQKPYYLMLCIQRWLLLVLNCIVGGLAVLLVAIALCVPSSSTAGGLGVALTTILSFNGSLQQLIVSWTQAETSLGSVARTKSYQETIPNENEGTKSTKPDDSWPRGKVEAQGLTVKYKDETVALSELTFEIAPGQKIGICGRTGSGKSTFVSVLLRLLDSDSGDLLVDGVDISTLDRNFVRERIICLPQDALLLPGTFEYNLNPQGVAIDVKELETALQKVQLLELVTKRGGLGSQLQQDSLSHGEQQLLALARAIVRKNLAGGRCILVLDEATSNLDPATEAIVEDIIEVDFKDNTVITVAHRLNTMHNCDIVLVLEKGRVIDTGSPDKVIDAERAIVSNKEAEKD